MAKTGPDPLIFGHRLRKERLYHSWTQAELARQLQCGESSIVSWEKGERLPHPSVRRAIYKLFATTEAAFLQSSTQEEQILWNVPFAYNPYFSGRKEILKQIHQEFSRQSGAICALHGPGGIGKTQIAASYAQTYVNHYQAILWLRAETNDMLLADFIELAPSMNIPGHWRLRDRPEELFGLLKHWLKSNPSWLLILDNVDEIAQIWSFLPAVRRGSTLITTRIHQATGKHIRRLAVGRLSNEESWQFLLNRIHVSPPLSEHEQQAAEQLLALFDGLPLALEQACAYIEETGCDLTTFLMHYLQSPTTLWERVSELDAGDYTHTLSTTWALSFQQIRQASRAAFDLLLFCSLLHPDAIQKKLLLNGASLLGPELAALSGDDAALEKLFSLLTRYSLLKRTRKGTFIIHRLVQSVLRASMSSPEDATLQIWGERALQVLAVLFPEVDFETWQHCEELFLHIQTILKALGNQPLHAPEVASLFQRVGDYLRERSRYTEAEHILTYALQICQTTPVPELLKAELYLSMGRYALDRSRYSQARHYLFQAQDILLHEQAEATVPGIKLLIALGDVTFAEISPQKALPFYQRGLALSQEISSSDRLKRLIAYLLDLIGQMYADIKDRHQAEDYLQQALVMRKQLFLEDHPDLLDNRSDLATLYQYQERYAEAEALYLSLLPRYEQLMGSEHRSTATCYLNIGALYKHWGKYDLAERYLQQAITIREKVLGKQHHDMANLLKHMADVCEAQGKKGEARSYLQRVDALNKQYLGPDNTESISIRQRLDDLS